MGALRFGTKMSPNYGSLFSGTAVSPCLILCDESALQKETPSSRALIQNQIMVILDLRNNESYQVFAADLIIPDVCNYLLRIQKRVGFGVKGGEGGARMLFLT